MSKSNRNPDSFIADTVIGKKIQIARHRCNVDQKNFAAAVSIPLELLSKYEDGSIRISSEELLSISNYTGHNIEWFFPDLLSDQQADKIVSQESYNDLISEAMERLSQIDDVIALRSVLGVLRFFTTEHTLRSGKD